MSQYSPYQYSSFNLDYNTLSHYHIITNRYKLLNQSSAPAHPGDVHLVHVLPLPPTKTALSLIGIIGIISIISMISIISLVSIISIISIIGIISMISMIGIISIVQVLSPPRRKTLLSLKSHSSWKETAVEIYVVMQKQNVIGSVCGR